MSAYMIVKKRGFSAYYYPKYWFNRVEQCNLGTIVTGQNVIAKEIAARVQASNKCYYGLPKILVLSYYLRNWRNDYTLRWFIRLFFIKWKSSYWENWQKKKIIIVERKMLRKMFEPVKDCISGEWRKNNELDFIPGYKYNGFNKKTTKKTKMGRTCLEKPK